MNPNTGAIATFETTKDAVDAGFTQQLTRRDYFEQMPRNRHERRKWAAEQRRKQEQKETKP
jgi:hypothetical protein